MTTAKVALEYDLAIPQATAIAHSTLQHLAEVLQGSACDIVIAAAVDLHPTFALLKLEHATG